MSTPQKLVAELRNLAADTEELIEQVAHQSGGRIAEARERARAAVSRTRAGLAAMAGAGVAQARHARAAADEYVHEHPWQTVLAAVAIAAVAALLISRRR